MMSGEKKWKGLVLGGAHRSGLLELGRIMRASKVAILCYHRFGSTDAPNGAISDRLFEAHLVYLKKHFTIISFEEMPGLLEGRLRVKNPLILTVDDGYRDFIEVALPLLTRHSAPATLFVTTRFIDGESWLWPDIIAHSVMRTRKPKIELSNCEPDLPLRTESEKVVAQDRLVDICRRMKEEEKTDFLADLTDRLGVKTPPEPTPEFRPASWEDLRRLDKE